MEKSAVLHIPMSPYAYGTDEQHVTIRLRTRAGDLTSCTLYYGDRACRSTPVLFTGAPMTRAATTNRYDWYEVRLSQPYKRLCYYFELSDETETVLYYGDCFSKTTVDDRSEYFQLPFNHRADIVTPPLWARDAVIYNIFPDSFATASKYISGEDPGEDFQGIKTHGKHGGTIRGIIENISYLKELGVTAIYINPVFAAGEYHKYDLLDYHTIDPCFGTNKDFKALVSVFHENGLKVIIDGVFNHCGWYFFAFSDVVKYGEQSHYSDWFYGLSFPVVRPEDPEAYPSYECFGYERMMPKLNLSNPETAEYFCEIGKHWITEYGIDGWRLDVASEVNDSFWRKFAAAVKSVSPDAILIGEIWETAGHWLDGTMFDSAMNYDFRKHCRRFFAERSIDAAEFHERVTDMLFRYREQTVFSQLNLLDSHDVSRFLSLCGGDILRYQLSVLFLMTFPGMPSVFYGDELGIEGIGEEDYRRPMPWDVYTKIACADGEKEEGESERKPASLFSFYKKLISLRKSEEALRRGAFHTLVAKQNSRLFGYERRTEDVRIIVFINAGDGEERIAWDRLTRLDASDISGINAKPERLLSERCQKTKAGDVILQPNGYLIMKILLQE